MVILLLILILFATLGIFREAVGIACGFLLAMGLLGALAFAMYMFAYAM